MFVVQFDPTRNTQQTLVSNVNTRNEVTVERRKVQGEERHCFYSSSNIARIIKLRRTRWFGLVAPTGVEI
jgi:hypothetical protein